MRALATTLAVSIILSFSAHAQTANNINPATGVAYGVDPATGKQWGPSHQWTGPGSAPGLSPYQVQCPDGSWSTAVGYCGSVNDGGSSGGAAPQSGQGGGGLDAEDIARLQSQVRFDPNSANGRFQRECQITGPDGKPVTYWSTSVGSCGGGGGSGSAGSPAGGTGGSNGSGNLAREGDRWNEDSNGKQCFTQKQHDEEKRLWDDMIARRCKPAYDYEKNECSEAKIKDSGNNPAVIKSCADSRAFWADLCFGNRPLGTFKPQFPLCSATGSNGNLKENTSMVNGKVCYTQANYEAQKKLWDDDMDKRCKPAFDYEKNYCSERFIKESGNNPGVIKSCADSRAFWADLCFGNRPLAQFKPHFPMCSGDASDLNTNQKYLACQKQHEYLSKNCKSVADWSSSGMNCKSIYNDAFKKDCSEFPALAFTPPVDDSSTKNKLYESCKDDQQYLVRNCNTYKSWSASQESCQKYYSSYNNYCGEFAKSLPFTPPHENDDRSSGSQNLKECTAYQQQFNRECSGFAPGRIMYEGAGQMQCSACEKPLDECKTQYESFMNHCDEFRVNLPLKLGTSSNGGTGNPNQCTALYSKFVEKCNAVSVKDEDRSDCKNLEVEYKAACATPATPTASDGGASVPSPGSGNPAGDSSNTSALETGNNGSMRITNQPDVSSACDAAMKSMLFHCNETSIFTKDCEAASAKKRQVCDGVHTPNYSTGNNQGSSGATGSADQNDRSDYCKKTYTYLTQHCVSGDAAGSGTCSDTRHNYDKICFGSGGDTGVRGGDTGVRGGDTGVRGGDTGVRGGDTGVRGGDTGVRGGDTGVRGGDTGVRGGDTGVRGGDTGNEGEDNGNQDSGEVGTPGGNGSSGNGSDGSTMEGLQLIPQ